MANDTPPPPAATGPGYGKEAPLLSVQPGGGRCMRAELAWGRLRRRFLRRFFPDYVAMMTAKRQGQCEGCPGRPHGCAGEVIDPRDLKYHRNVCGYSFRPED